MRNTVRARWRGIGAVAAASVLVAGTAGCETTEAAPETVVVEVPGPGMPPPAAPWTMAQLTYHPCVVLAEPELARFALESPGRARTPPQLPNCSWQSRDGADRPYTLGFVPDHDGNYEVTADVYREKSPDDTRTLTVADRPAFLFVDDAVPPLGCTVHVSVRSGGLFQLSADYEPGAMSTPQDCDTLVEIATVVAERTQ
ncbi:DUF3558 family protein [Nocardia carnea]|uniref:DUF3558 family protein n=1 Tax=Nocardia carnea TaxID=37328 RepID=UPI002455471B|nr:DUF3558 family protein [Nocardia carnea]